MRPTTIVWLAARNVGLKGGVVEVWEGPFPKVVIELAKWMGQEIMATRFDVAIGRNEGNVRDAIRIRGERDHLEGKLSGELTAALDAISGLIQSGDDETAGGA